PGLRPAGRARAKVRLQRAALARVERSREQPPDGDAVEAVAERQLLGEPVAGGKERLLDLRHRQREPVGDLVDPEPVQLPQDVRVPLPLGERRDGGDERARRGRVARRRLLGQPLRRRLAAPQRHVERGVVRGAVEPRPHVLRPAVRAQRRVRLQQRRVGHVLAGGRVAEEVGAVGGQAVGVAAVELVEGSRLATGEAAAEDLVGKPAEQDRAHADDYRPKRSSGFIGASAVAPAVAALAAAGLAAAAVLAAAGVLAAAAVLAAAGVLAAAAAVLTLAAGAARGAGLLARRRRRRVVVLGVVPGERGQAQRAVGALREGREHLV